MDTSLTQVSAENAFAERLPLIAEVVGPAGAGKTTLVLALSQRNERIRTVFSLRRVRYIPSFVGHAFSLLPTFLRQSRNGSGFTWQEIRLMTHLEAMQHAFGRTAPNYRGVTILDQGPVYMLARLHSFGFGNVRGRSLAQWWSDLLDRWAANLDMLIWLDASDMTLVDRIHARGKWHSVKEKPEQEAVQFLAGFRASCEQIIARLTAHGGPRVLYFNTDRDAPDQIVAEILAEFDSKRVWGRRA